MFYSKWGIVGGCVNYGSGNLVMRVFWIIVRRGGWFFRMFKRSGGVIMFVGSKFDRNSCVENWVGRIVFVSKFNSIEVDGRFNF